MDHDTLYSMVLELCRAIDPLQTAVQVHCQTGLTSESCTEAEWSTNTAQLRIVVQHCCEVLILAEKGLMRRPERVWSTTLFCSSGPVELLYRPDT